MKSTKMYRYVGVNGTLTTYILIEGAKYSLRYHLVADKGMLLTDGQRTCRAVEIPEADLSKWTEVRDPQADVE